MQYVELGNCLVCQILSSYFILRKNPAPMKLQAVFWDYPKFLNKEYLESYLRENRDTDAFSWILARFLEHGRAVDTLTFFSINDIAARLPSLKLSEYAAKKWRRLVEVYASRS